jgi:putative radical SAM enzyme (TIGR03279 family)
MLKILSVERDSIAEQTGIKVGDYLISINNHEINDFLDYQFHITEEIVELKIKREDKYSTFKFNKFYDEDIGLDFPEVRLKSCGNDCIFCFIDQNPPGMRKSLYFHDEDYRFSFLFGNYITLSNVTERDIERIIYQRLSPLYISVHATDPEIRKRILRPKINDSFLEKLEILSRNSIDIHTQIVLMPGINDGEILEKTLKDLYHFRNVVKSVAIVPVGLTKHRKVLPEIIGVDSKYAAETIALTREWNRNYFNIEGDQFVYLADEFYLLANRPTPSKSHYGQFYQIENGVGLVRKYIDNFTRQFRKFPKSVKKPTSILFVTGTLAKPVIEKYIVNPVNQIENFHVDVFPVKNNFFGESITVAGLLTATDILEQVKPLLAKRSYEKIYLPPRCVNEDNLLLDDFNLDEIQEELNLPVVVFNNDFVEMVKDVTA